MSKQGVESIDSDIDDDIVHTVLENNFEVPKKQRYENVHTDVVSNGLNQIFHAKSDIYKDVLSPQLSKNEELKRKQRTKLIKNIFGFLRWQFIATYVLIFFCMGMIGYNKCIGISDEIILEIFGFLKYYITTVIAELIAILFFIVKNVFDKSIIDLLKNFDKGK